MRAFIALVVIVILFTVGGQLKGFWKWVRGLDPMTVGAILGAPILIIGTITYKSVNGYLKQTPWERCISSKDTYVQMADYECRIELGMEPIEKPVFSRKKKVTLSPEREAELKAILFRQKDVTLSPEDMARVKAILYKPKEDPISPEEYAELDAIFNPQNEVTMTPDQDAEPTSQNARQDDDSE